MFKNVFKKKALCPPPPPPLARNSEHGPVVQRDEPVFVNVYGAQESILPGWESIPGFLKRFANTGSECVLCKREERGGALAMPQRC